MFGITIGPVDGNAAVLCDACLGVVIFVLLFLCVAIQEYAATCAALQAGVVTAELLVQQVQAACTHAPAQNSRDNQGM
jgi:hypothetical protein